MDEPKRPDLKVIDGYYAASVPPQRTGWQRALDDYWWVLLLPGVAMFLWFGGHYLLIGAALVAIMIKIGDLIVRAIRARRRSP